MKPTTYDPARAGRFETLIRLAAASFDTHDSDIARIVVAELAGLSSFGELQEPATVPVCDALISFDREPVDSLVQQILHCTNALAWRMPGFGRLSEDISARMGVVEFAGPDGMVAHQSIRFGLLLQGAGVAYPPHRHAAEELYLVLAGTADWSVEQCEPVSHGPGAFIWHKPWQTHAMQTSSTPMLALWGWTGELSSASYSA